MENVHHEWGRERGKGGKKSTKTPSEESSGGDPGSLPPARRM